MSSRGKKKKNISRVAEETLNSVPVSLLCTSIEEIIKVLESRGYPVYDFDNKEKTVKQVRMIGGKVYFLVTQEGSNANTT